MRNSKRTGIVLGVIFAGAIIICAVVWCVFLSFSYSSPVAYVYCGETLIHTIPLDGKHDCEFTVECESGYNRIKVEGAKISVTDADCPDKVCVDTGWIENGLVPIACVPHKLLIRIEGARTDVAAVAK